MHRFRFILVMLTFVSAFSYLGFNLYYLQIKQSSYYQAKAESQYSLAGLLEAHRGVIYLTDKNQGAIPAAINRSVPVIFTIPSAIDDIKEAVASLAPITGGDKEKLQTALERQSTYEVLVKKASESQVSAIRALQLKGVYVDNQESRYYPFTRLASHLLGFVAPASEGNGVAGTYGVEAFYESQLGGKPGSIDNKKIIAAISGQDVYLTIDRDIQTRAEEILRDMVAKFSAAGGSVMVQEAKTGRILAMGSLPDFDPNEYGKSQLSDFMNPAVQTTYEPGSVFKVITMAAGLDSGAITPDSTYYDNGVLEVGGVKIKNWDLKSHGKLTMTQVIEQSVNTGSVFAEKLIGNKTFYDYLVKFGFSQPTQVNLPGEAAGNLKNLTDIKNLVNFATAAFGQGITATPVQLITAVSTIANGGTLMRPTVLAADEPEEVRQVISRTAASQVTAMMESALKKAEIGSVEHYRLAGKTGTAQVADLQHGGYTKDVINSYIGFGPVSDPRFTILLKLEKPAGAPLAGQTVVPAFRELARFILNYYNIPPDSP